MATTNNETIFVIREQIHEIELSLEAITTQQRTQAVSEK